VLKHKSGFKDKVVDALSHIGCLLHTMRVEVIGFHKLKVAYSSCPDLGLVYSELLAGNRRPYVDFVFHDGYLFRGSQFCVPRTSFRDFLIWKMHAGGLASHLSKDRTVALVEDRFHWPSLKRDVSCIVSQCRTCQLAKARKHKTGLYTSLTIPHAPWRNISMDFGSFCLEHPVVMT